jgi:hypothetical protein
MYRIPDRGSRFVWFGRVTWLLGFWCEYHHADQLDSSCRIDQPAIYTSSQLGHCCNFSTNHRDCVRSDEKHLGFDIPPNQHKHIGLANERNPDAWPNAAVYRKRRRYQQYYSHWSISPLIGSISLSGLYTAPASVVSPQTVTVRATSVADPTKLATAPVVVTPPGDTSPPTAPGSLTATTANPNQINLSWSAATDNVGVTGYRVERCQGASCTNFTQIAAPSGTNYSNSGLTASTSYRYRVRATDAAGNLSSYSAIVNATTSASLSLTGLVAAYSFNQGSGTTVADASGYANTGTIVGASWTTAGRYGGALSFNGTSSYVNLGNRASLQLTGSMTWSAWVKAAANPWDDGQIIAKSDNSSGWQFKSSPDTGQHTFGVAVSGSTSSHTQRYSRTVRSLNTWYHVAGVYNAAARTLDIYVNGVLDNGVLRGTVPSSQYNANVDVTIGRRSGGFYFNGIIDQVRVYNRALSATEIQTDMNTPIP